MITYSLLYIALGLLYWMVYYIPTVTELPFNLNEPLGEIGAVLTNVNFFFPLDLLLGYILIWVVLEGSYNVFKMSEWTFKRIRR